MTQRTNANSRPRFRVYPLGGQELTEEQVAVAFAMTSRRPEPFDEIAQRVSEERAANFHERWVLGYGHSSVAEHAVVHLAVENVSRLACDALEDNRLASYTEKSSRYQVMERGHYHVPAELEGKPALRLAFGEACDGLFSAYARLVDGCAVYLGQEHPQGVREPEGAYKTRLRRMAADHARTVLPAALLTNVGVTANARTLERAISKLLSGRLMEETALGTEVRWQARLVTPTLIKYAERNVHLADLPAFREGLSEGFSGAAQGEERPETSTTAQTRLVEWDQEAEVKLVAALLYGGGKVAYADARSDAAGLGAEGREDILARCLERLGPHDPPPREFELVDYTFEYLMDYGGYREFKRHRMQTYLPQMLSVAHGYQTPPVVVEAGLADEFAAALDRAEEVYWKVHEVSPVVAQYLVTHAHNRRVLSKLNLRECYHLFKLRTSNEAHFSVRGSVLEALRLAVEKQPALFRHLQLREYPDWWPFGEEATDRDGGG